MGMHDRLKRVERIEEALKLQAAVADLRVKEATRNPYVWVTEYAQTYNPHWVEEERPAPYEHFPKYDYFRELFTVVDLEPIVWIEKSRDLMISWACVAYLTLHAMTVPECGVLFQTQKEVKAVELVRYAKCLYERQPPWLRDAFPLAKPLRAQPE